MFLNILKQNMVNSCTAGQGHQDSYMAYRKRLLLSHKLARKISPETILSLDIYGPESTKENLLTRYYFWFSISIVMTRNESQGSEDLTTPVSQWRKGIKRRLATSLEF